VRHRKALTPLGECRALHRTSDDPLRLTAGVGDRYLVESICARPSQNAFCDEEAPANRDQRGHTSPAPGFALLAGGCCP
jgi:hypothetical protein